MTAGHDWKVSWRLLRDVSAEPTDPQQEGFEILFAEWVRATHGHSRKTLGAFAAAPPNPP